MATVHSVFAPCQRGANGERFYGPVSASNLTCPCNKSCRCALSQTLMPRGYTKKNYRTVFAVFRRKPSARNRTAISKENHSCQSHNCFTHALGPGASALSHSW